MDVEETSNRVDAPFTGYNVRDIDSIGDDMKKRGRGIDLTLQAVFD